MYPELLNYHKRYRHSPTTFIIRSLIEFDRFFSTREKEYERTHTASTRSGLTIRGPHTNVRLGGGGLSHTRIQHFLRDALFFPEKVDDLL